MKAVLLTLFVFLITTISFGQWNRNTMLNNIVSNTDEYEGFPFTVTDGSGGSIVFFYSFFFSNTDSFSLKAQKISAGGTIQWGTTTSPVIIKDSVLGQYSANAIPDGNGGAFVAWENQNNNTGFLELYIQHISSSGNLLWGNNGVKVSAVALREDYGPSLCSDGNGGLIISWTGDDRVSNSQMYAQRYNSSGTRQWTPGGVQLCTAASFRLGTSLVADNNNGAIFFFTDFRNDPDALNYDSMFSNSSNTDIYAQRVNGNGTRLWTDSGVAISKANGNQDGYDNCKAVSDGAGGAIFVFTDGRNDTIVNYQSTNLDVFAQKVNASGIVVWAPDGIPLCTLPGNQYTNFNSIVTDGRGGMVAAWEDGITGSLRTQRITAAGASAWPANGADITPAFVYAVHYPVVMYDSAGNFVYAFECNNQTFDRTINAQKLDTAGLKKWGTNGILVSGNGGNGYPQYPGEVLSDTGSVILSFSDYRNFSFQSNSTEIYASKINASGSLQGDNIFITIANGNWNSTGTWMGGTSPMPNVSAIVRHGVNVTSNAECYSVKVEQPAGSLTVKTGVQFKVSH